MSRRITIATKLDNADLVEESLNELEAEFTLKNNTFNIKSAEGERFMYTGASINVEEGEVGYDEDDRRAKSFVQNRLVQIYNKNLYLETAALEGHQIDRQYEADSSTYIDGFTDLIEEGDIVIESEASF